MPLERFTSINHWVPDKSGDHASGHSIDQFDVINIISPSMWGRRKTTSLRRPSHIGVLSHPLFVLPPALHLVVISLPHESVFLLQLPFSILSVHPESLLVKSCIRLLLSLLSERESVFRGECRGRRLMQRRMHGLRWGPMLAVALMFLLLLLLCDEP